MKKFLANVLVIVFIFTLLVSSFAVYAEKPLYEKYEYQEDFDYNKEMIGHALKAAVPKILLTFEAKIRYQPMTIDVDGLADQIEIWHAELSSEYTDEQISEIITEHLRENIYYYTSFGGYKESESEAMAHGSGVVISEDGYIATNAHVASLDEETKKYLYMSSLDSSVSEDFYSLIEEIDGYGVTLSESDYYELYDMLWEHACEDVQVKDETTTLQVCFAAPDGKASLDASKIYDAEVVEIGTQEGVDGLTQDTAILKIEAKNLIALPLSDTYPESNSDIYTAGYPAVADEIFSSVGSEASSVAVSIGEGTVARTIDIDGFKYKAIEITSTISGGNSGGPSVDKNLNIEGLNTYSSVSDNRYAYMISSEFVKSLTTDYDIGLGETSKTFLTGLQLMQNEYGDAAQRCFDHVKELKEDTPYLDYLSAVVDREKLDKEHPADLDKEHPADIEEPKNDKAEEKSFLDIVLENLVLVIIGGVLILAIIIISIVLACKNSKKKKSKADAVVSSHSYTPITPVTTPTPPMVDDTLLSGNSVTNQASAPGNIQSLNVSSQNSYSENSTGFEQPSAPAVNITPEYTPPQPAEPSKPRLKSTMKKSSDDLN